MIKLLLCLLFSFSAYSAVKVEMDFSTSDIKQGELVESRLEIQNTDKFEVSKLKGQSVGKTVYFYEISPLMKREGDSFYEADAKVIFINTPTAANFQEVVNGQEIELVIGNVQVKPTEGSKSLIFGKFTVPEQAQWVIWLVAGLLGVFLLSLMYWKVSGNLRKKREEKDRLLALKNEILGCRNYEDIVSLWKKKHFIVKEFPHIQDPFVKLEEVLNRHQFKSKQSEAEKIEVVESYRKFSRSVEGGFNGL